MGQNVLLNCIKIINSNHYCVASPYALKKIMWIIMIVGKIETSIWQYDTLFFFQFILLERSFCSFEKCSLLFSCQSHCVSGAILVRVNAGSVVLWTFCSWQELHYFNKNLWSCNVITHSGINEDNMWAWLFVCHCCWGCLLRWLQGGWGRGGVRVTSPQKLLQWAFI